MACLSFLFRIKQPRMGQRGLLGGRARVCQSLKYQWERPPATPEYQTRVTVLTLGPVCHAVTAGGIGEAVPCRAEPGCAGRAAARTPTLRRDGEQPWGANAIKHSLEKKPHSSRCCATGNAGP